VPMPKQKKQRGGQPGAKALKLEPIRVLNKFGEVDHVYEREFRERIPATDRHRKMVAYELSSGERVQQIDEYTFVLLSTGEKYVRAGG
jgi:hypothetical protein